MTGVDPSHLTDAELAAWVGHGLHPEKAGRLIEEVRRLRRELANAFDAVGEAEAEVRAADHLRARLAEVEAENDGLRHVIEHGVKGNATRLTDLKAAQARLAEMTREAQLSRGATERAVARLAEVEAERDEWRRVAAEQTRLERGRAEAAEARLAAVLALCDERQREIQATWGVPIGSAGRLDIADVRAAAAGDRAELAGYVRRCDCATPGNCDGCHCWRPE